MLATVTVAVYSPGSAVTVPETDVPLQEAPAGRPVTLEMVALVAVMLTVVMAEFWQMVCVGTSTDTVGSGLTTTSTYPVAGQWLASSPVAVYLMVVAAVGVAVIVEPVVVAKPADADGSAVHVMVP